MLGAQYPGAGSDPGSSRAALPYVLTGLEARVQHRNCADRDRGADGDRCPVSDLRRSQVERGSAGCAGASAARRTRSEVTRLPDLPACFPVLSVVTTFYSRAPRTSDLRNIPLSSAR